ncbi:Breakpoint cluster region protein [Rhizoctonia solani]|uniref:Breakpoint cluster region protein n=1 Tax=Rhizoctonia solani TaxID=456999 RepID=A0A0K6G7L9_9AGAM|nr:Breakpoint cluster region protein [Rhizoctonia solani]
MPEPQSQSQYPPRTMSLPKGTPPGSPVPRSPSPTDWGDDIPVVSIAAGSLGDDIVPTGFDEAVLRNLCELDCGVPLLLDRIKQSMVSCREASIFFRKRAALEDEFGRGMYKLARTTSEVYAMNDGKAGSFVSAWSSTMKIHELMGESRIRLAQRLAEMSDELASLAKEVEKNRKSAKDLGTRYERALQDAEAAMEKAKARVSAVTEELERVLVAKEGETMKDAGLRGADGRVIGTGGAGKGALGKAVAKGGALLKGKPASLQKQEEDIRARLSMASDGYRQSMLETQKIRQEYFNFQLPRILRSLKECADEIDLGTQYHLSRYAFLLESTILSDGATLCPMSIEDGPGIKLTIESIDNRTDFKVYMQNYAVAHGAPKGPRREGPAEDGFLPPLPTLDTVQSHVSSSTSGHPSSSTSSVPSSTPTYPHAQAYGPTQIFPPPASHQTPVSAPVYSPSFGIPLAHLVVRDGTEQPKVLTKCAEAIEKHGLDSVGIYRLSGTTSRVRELRSVLDKDIENVDLDSKEWTTDINNITSVLKMWFRELPEPLLTWELYSHFVEAAQIEGERLRSIRLHEHVNALPDANYSTLKYLMGHLYRISEREHVNQMSRSNLAIVFGPTLLGARREDGELGASVQDTSWQCKAIETILDKYVDIFVE